MRGMMEGFWTLLGVLLGWLLSYISRWGRLIINCEYKGEFTTQKYGGTEKVTKITDAAYYEYEIKLFLYNNSQMTKGMRDIKLELCQKRKRIEELPFIEQEGQVGVYSIASILAWNSEKIELSYRWPLSYMNEIDNLKNVNRIYISYRNERNKTKRKKVVTTNFKDFFANLEE